MSPHLHHGVICEIGKPSFLSPVGARGHRVALSSTAAMGMVIDRIVKATLGDGVPLLDGHHGERIGEVLECHLVEGRLEFLAWAFAPLPGSQVSYGVDGGRVRDERKKVWEIVKIGGFSHLAVVGEGKAAHREALII